MMCLFYGYRRKYRYVVFHGTILVCLKNTNVRETKTNNKYGVSIFSRYTFLLPCWPPCWVQINSINEAITKGTLP